MQRALLYALTLGALVYIGLIRSTSSAPPAVAAAPVASQTSDRRELDALRRQLTALTEDVDSLFDTQDQLVDQVSAPPIAEEAEIVDEADLDAHTAQTQSILATALEREPADPKWAPEAESTMQERLLDLGDAVRSIDHVECRRTLCRVEIHYDEAAIDPNALADRLGSLAPWGSNGFYSVETTGERRAWVYLSREGFGLPPA